MIKNTDAEKRYFGRKAKHIYCFYPEGKRNHLSHSGLLCIKAHSGCCRELNLSIRSTKNAFEIRKLELEIIQLLRDKGIYCIWKNAEK